MSSVGEPGKPGEPPIGQQGGRGGEGGKGGAGQPEGGGGKGGAGGRGATGRVGPQGPQGEDGAGGKWWRLVLSAWIIVFTVVVGYNAHQNRQLVRENRARIAQINESRVTSCQRIYRSFPEMFRPFPIPKKQFQKVEARAEELASRCHI
jgi:hypothetical protein